MALYLGNSKVKINSNYLKYFLNIYSSTPITNGVILKSSDNYILKDCNGLYLTASDYMKHTLLSLDNLMLTDLNKVYLIPKEDK